MRTRLTLRPGDAGTHKLVQQFGDRLLCVRYRYDEKRQLRLKTAEIIVDARAWLPEPRDLPTAPHDPASPLHHPTPSHTHPTTTHPRTTSSPPPDDLDYINIRFDHTDRDLRTAVKRLGGYWDPESNTWRITRAAATLLDLTPL